MSDGTLTVEKLIEIKKKFDEMFPPRDVAKDTSVLSMYMFQEFGFKIVPMNVPDDCIAVSPEVYAIICGIKRPSEYQPKKKGF